MKKLLTWLLCLMMLVSAVPALAYTTGTYTGTGTGMLDKIEVAVTFDADTITGIEVVSCNDTPGVCDAAVEKIPAETWTRSRPSRLKRLRAKKSNSPPTLWLSAAAARALPRR